MVESQLQVCRREAQGASPAVPMHDGPAERVGASQEPGCAGHVAARYGPADGAALYDPLTQEHGLDRPHPKAQVSPDLFDNGDGAVPVVPHGKIRPHHHGAHLQVAAEQGQELPSAELGQFQGELQVHHPFDPRIPQPGYAFLQGGDVCDGGSGRQHRARMISEGQHAGDKPFRKGHRAELADKVLVAEVHTIKDSDGKGGVYFRCEPGELFVNCHAGPEYPLGLDKANRQKVKGV